MAARGVKHVMRGCFAVKDVLASETIVPASCNSHAWLGRPIQTLVHCSRFQPHCLLNLWTNFHLQERLLFSSEAFDKHFVWSYQSHLTSAQRQMRQHLTSTLADFDDLNKTCVFMNPQHLPCPRFSCILLIHNLQFWQFPVYYLFKI